MSGPLSGIDIRAADAHEYHVRLPGVARDLLLRMPERYLEKVDVTDSYEALLARKSVEYVVERGVAGQLPEVFTPEDIERLLPDYPVDIQARLSG